MPSPLINQRLETYYLIILLVILISAGHVSAQDSRCKNKLNDLPAAAELKGFRLAMTMEQVKARVPQAVFGPADSLGVSKTSIHPFFDPRIDKSTFEGVRTISLDFLDGRLTSLWIGYDGSAKWPTVNDFVRGISQSLLLPNAWAPWTSRGEQLRCADFELTVTMVAGGPSFRIQDQTAEETWTARRAAQAEQESAQEESNPEEELIFGDRHSKIYYTKDCQPGKSISEPDLVVFKTREDAEKAGFKPPKTCL